MALNGTRVTLKGTRVTLKGTTGTLKGTSVTFKGTSVTFKGTRVTLKGTSVTHLNIAQGHEREARGLGVDVLPRLQQRIAHRAERNEVRRHLEPALCARLNIFRTRLQCQLEQLLAAK
jgi:hypothetical protein